ncbi:MULTISPECIES: dihydrofolate reductase [Bacillus]|uniref:dihydrofolate reductase n=1 Tax=Bacillus TaxID=1386 RepID=UPI000C75BEB0|nr:MULTISPECIES: dihydrofolate reductase [Bacillus]PLR82747.1 dihydrofolate reductase [Bacillus sp. V33-4]RSK49738.1 dihydrofolate reductase [Bacillus canaveralius]
MISLIWAMDENRVIGRDNRLPWHLPEDLKFFKRVTMGHPVVMGRKTYESIGRLLPGRENIIITRNRDYQVTGATLFYSIADFAEYANGQEEEFFVIGGSEIFKEIFTAADRLYLTQIHAEFDGDTYFPDLDLNEWELVSKEPGLKNEKNPYDYEFLIYHRK